MNVIKQPAKTKEKPLKYVRVLEYGDSLLEKLNFTFSEVVKKVVFLKRFIEP